MRLKPEAVVSSHDAHPGRPLVGSSYFDSQSIGCGFGVFWAFVEKPAQKETQKNKKAVLFLFTNDDNCIPK